MIINNISSIGYSSGIRQVTSRSYHLTNPPNYGSGGMPTKSAPIMSDVEFKAKIEEMARKDAFAGKEIEARNSSAEYHDLLRNYISVDSPDRKGIVDNTLSNLAGKLRVMAPRLNFTYDLMSLLMGHSVMFNSRDIGTNFINFRDANGNITAMYSERPFGGGMGWTHCPTDAENAREREFANIYYDAFFEAQSEPARAERNASIIIDIIEKGRSVDIAALRAGGTVINMDMLKAHGIFENSYSMSTSEKEEQTELDIKA